MIRTDSSSVSTSVLAMRWLTFLVLLSGLICSIATFVINEEALLRRETKLNGVSHLRKPRGILLGIARDFLRLKSAFLHDLAEALEEHRGGNGHRISAGDSSASAESHADAASASVPGDSYASSHSTSVSTQHAHGSSTSSQSSSVSVQHESGSSASAQSTSISGQTGSDSSASSQSTSISGQTGSGSSASSQSASISGQTGSGSSASSQSASISGQTGSGSSASSQSTSISGQTGSGSSASSQSTSISGQTGSDSSASSQPTSISGQTGSGSSASSQSANVYGQAVSDSVASAISGQTGLGSSSSAESTSTSSQAASGSSASALSESFGHYEPNLGIAQSPGTSEQVGFVTSAFAPFENVPLKPNSGSQSSENTFKGYGSNSYASAQSSSSSGYYGSSSSAQASSMSGSFPPHPVVPAQSTSTGGPYGSDIPAPIHSNIGSQYGPSSIAQNPSTPGHYIPHPVKPQFTNTGGHYGSSSSAQSSSMSESFPPYPVVPAQSISTGGPYGSGIPAPMQSNIGSQYGTSSTGQTSSTPGHYTPHPVKPSQFTNTGGHYGSSSSAQSSSMSASYPSHPAAPVQSISTGGPYGSVILAPIQSNIGSQYGSSSTPQTSSTPGHYIPHPVIPSQFTNTGGHYGSSSSAQASSVSGYYGLGSSHTAQFGNTGGHYGSSSSAQASSTSGYHGLGSSPTAQYGNTGGYHGPSSSAQASSMSGYYGSSSSSQASSISGYYGLSPLPIGQYGSSGGHHGSSSSAQPSNTAGFNGLGSSVIAQDGNKGENYGSVAQPASFIGQHGSTSLSQASSASGQYGQGSLPTQFTGINGQHDWNSPSSEEYSSPTGQILSPQLPNLSEYQNNLGSLFSLPVPSEGISGSHSPSSSFAFTEQQGHQSSGLGKPVQTAGVHGYYGNAHNLPTFQGHFDGGSSLSHNSAGYGIQGNQAGNQGSGQLLSPDVTGNFSPPASSAHSSSVSDSHAPETSLPSNSGTSNHIPEPSVQYGGSYGHYGLFPIENVSDSSSHSIHLQTFTYPKPSVSPGTSNCCTATGATALSSISQNPSSSGEYSGAVLSWNYHGNYPQSNSASVGYQIGIKPTVAGSDEASANSNLGELPASDSCDDFQTDIHHLPPEINTAVSEKDSSAPSQVSNSGNVNYVSTIAVSTAESGVSHVKNDPICVASPSFTSSKVGQTIPTTDTNTVCCGDSPGLNLTLLNSAFHCIENNPKGVENLSVGEVNAPMQITFQEGEVVPQQTAAQNNFSVTSLCSDDEEMSGDKSETGSVPEREIYGSASLSGNQTVQTIDASEIGASVADIGTFEGSEAVSGITSVNSNICGSSAIDVPFADSQNLEHRCSSDISESVNTKEDSTNEVLGEALSAAVGLNNPEDENVATEAANEILDGEDNTVENLEQ